MTPIGEPLGEDGPAAEPTGALGGPETGHGAVTRRDDRCDDPAELPDPRLATGESPVRGDRGAAPLG